MTKPHYVFAEWIVALHPTTFEALKARAYYCGETVLKYGIPCKKYQVIGKWEKI